MGSHDPGMIWHTHAADAAPSIHDDGRTLRRVRDDEYLHTYDEYGHLVPDGDVLPSYAREAFLFRGEELIPEVVLQVHSETFTPTKWESLYSSLSKNGTADENFTPVIDDNCRIVG